MWQFIIIIPMTKRNTNIIMTIMMYLIISTLCNQSSQQTQKIVEVSPTALDVLIHSFDQLVILLHQKQSGNELDDILQILRQQQTKIHQYFPDDHTLYGYVNITQDYDRNLDKYGHEQGIIVLNRFQTSVKITDFSNGENLFKIYQKIAHPKLPLTYRTSQQQDKNYSYTVYFKFNNSNELANYNLIYKRILHFLDELSINAYAVPIEKGQNASIWLYQEQDQIKEYKYYNLTIVQQANQLLQQINIDTLPIVTTLKQSNMHRVFGGVISQQILLLQNQNEKDSQNQYIRQQFKKAALFNKEQQLSYQRVLFCYSNNDFYQEQFNEESSSMYVGQNKYAILFIKTDYDRFNLQRYIFTPKEENVTFEQIISFINDVKMKKLDPQYRSQKVLTQQENTGILKKIVGNTFIKQIYEKPDESIIVLFIDSKDELSYIEIKKVLEQYVRRNQQKFKGKITFGIFDLAKNEHKLLYLKEAPQLVLFDKSNKKQSKYFKIQNGITQQLLQKWITKQVSNLSQKAPQQEL